MNTIGKEDPKKLDMTLDEIIASEPLRYTGSDMRPPDYGKNALKVYRPKTFGRFKQVPYHQGDRPSVKKLKDPWANYTKSPMHVSLADRNKVCPYMFKYNGVYVTENSPLLNRTVGEVEAIPTQAHREDDEDDEEEEEVEEDVDEDVNITPSTHKPMRPAPQRVMFPQRRFKDMTYVRLPVHQRLGINPNQFVKSRVNLAAKILRSRHHQPQFLKYKANKRQGIHLRRHSDLSNRRLKMSTYHHHNEGETTTLDNGMKVNFSNDLAQPTGQTAIVHDEGVFVAPLSRKNVEQLSGRFLANGPLSQISSVSKSNEDILHERLSQVENILFQSQVGASGMSVMNGYMPLSRQLTMNNVMSAPQTDSGISMLGGLPMSNVSNSGMSVFNAIPMVNGGMTLVGGVGGLQQPVAVMMSGDMQSFVPMMNSGPSTSSQFMMAQQPCMTGRVVISQDGSFVIKSVPTLQNVSPTSNRFHRQLHIAAIRQPLDDGIQNNICATQAGLRINSLNRFADDSFNYQPKPHVTQSSISKRISCLPPQMNRAPRGRRPK